MTIKDLPAFLIKYVSLKSHLNYDARIQLLRKYWVHEKTYNNKKNSYSLKVYKDSPIDLF